MRIEIRYQGKGFAENILPIQQAVEEQGFMLAQQWYEKLIGTHILLFEERPPELLNGVGRH